MQDKMQDKNPDFWGILSDSRIWIQDDAEQSTNLRGAKNAHASKVNTYVHVRRALVEYIKYV